jgi:hypothetical protein
MYIWQISGLYSTCSIVAVSSRAGECQGPLRRGGLRIGAGIPTHCTHQKCPQAQLLKNKKYKVKEQIKRNVLQYKILPVPVESNLMPP